MFQQTTRDLHEAYEAFIALVQQNRASQTDREIAALYAQILHKLEPASSSEYFNPPIGLTRPAASRN